MGIPESRALPQGDSSPRGGAGLGASTDFCSVQKCDVAFVYAVALIRSGAGMTETLLSAKKLAVF